MPPNFKQYSGTFIGSDEALKGDTFGGIVVAAVKADDEIRKKLLALGVADSKTLTDGRILTLAPKIEKIAGIAVRACSPPKQKCAAHSLHVRKDSHPGKNSEHVVTLLNWSFCEK